METRFFVVLIVLLVSLHLSAQDTAKVVDRVSTLDNKATIGQITTDKRGEFVVIDVYHEGLDTILYSTISTVEYRIDNPGTDTTAHSDPAIISNSKADTIVTAPVITIAPDKPQSIVMKDTTTTQSRSPYVYPIEVRRAGVGLTVGGIVMIGAAAALIALTPRTAGKSFLYSVTPGTAAGFILAAAGVAITIPGALIWSKYNRQHKKQ